MPLNRMALFGLFVGAAVVSACTSVRRVQPAQYLEANSPPMVWVTYTNNTVVSVADPEVRRDTLRGTLQGARVKIPLRDVQSIQARVPNHTKTALLLTSLGVAAVSSVYFIWVVQAGGGSGVGESVYCGTDKYGRNLMYC